MSKVEAVPLEDDRMPRVTPIVCLFGLFLLFGLISCSGSSNNDQGTSFLALGYFEELELGGAGGGGAGGQQQFLPIAGISALLFSDTAQVLGDEPGLPIEGRVLSDAYIGLENRLSEQFLRVTRINCSYFVPEATIGIPDDQINVSTVLGAVNTETDEGAEPPIQQIRGQFGFLQFELVSPDLFSYLNNNINSFPPLPFTMTASCFATGVTEAGDVLETNSVSLPITFYDSPECCVGGNGVVGPPGFQGGPGTGGNFDSFDDDSTVTPGGAAEVSEASDDLFRDDIEYFDE